MQKNNKNFFEQMNDSNYYDVNRKLNFLNVLTYIFSAIFIILWLVYENGWLYDIINEYFIVIILAIFLIISLYQLVLIFKKNNILFLKGNFSKGIFNLIYIIILVFIFLFSSYLTSDDENVRTRITSLISPIITLFCGALALLGVLYSLIHKQINDINRSNLIFRLTDIKGAEINILKSNNEMNTCITLENVSNNYGYFIGIYRICGCDIYNVGETLPYLPILPHEKYTFSNICYEVDDDIIIVYKDIDKTYYYILLKFESKNCCRIERVEHCDYEFLLDRLNESEKTNDMISAIKSRIAQPIKENDIELDEIQIMENKLKTKPKYTKFYNGFDLIVSEQGEILTDIVLLQLLKSERLKISKQNKMKAYMILNNQQLVALATYKPTDKVSFVSIYGLGEKKYELYGDQMINIIKNYNENKKIKNNR